MKCYSTITYKMRIILWKVANKFGWRKVAHKCVSKVISMIEKEAKHDISRNH